jgi:hypothetical protein
MSKPTLAERVRAAIAHYGFDEPIRRVEEGPDGTLTIITRARTYLWPAPDQTPRPKPARKPRPKKQAAPAATR